MSGLLFPVFLIPSSELVSSVPCFNSHPRGSVRSLLPARLTLCLFPLPSSWHQASKAFSPPAPRSLLCGRHAALAAGARGSQQPPPAPPLRHGPLTSTRCRWLPATLLSSDWLRASLFGFARQGSPATAEGSGCLPPCCFPPSLCRLRQASACPSSLRAGGARDERTPVAFLHLLPY